jgi:hypothetical protein
MNSNHGESMMRFAMFLPVLVLLGGCPAEEEDPGPVGPFTYEEDDDRGNYRRSFAEDVGDDWGTELVIQGSMEECTAEESGSDWDYNGDRDYFEFEVTGDGWLEIVLEWEHDSDLDLVVRTNGDDREMLDGVDEVGPEDFAPEDPHEEGDDINIGIFCKTGGAGDYTVTVELELD